MELKPRLKLRNPMEMPFRIPKSMTVFKSTDLDTNRFKRWAAWRVQNVTIKCQLVSVVAGSNGIKKTKVRYENANKFDYWSPKLYDFWRGDKMNDYHQKGSQDCSSRLCCRWQWRQKKPQREIVHQSHPIGSLTSLPSFL